MLDCFSSFPVGQSLSSRYFTLQPIQSHGPPKLEMKALSVKDQEKNVENLRLMDHGEVGVVTIISPHLLHGWLNNLLE